MSDLNMVQAIGRLGKDPESKSTPQGTVVCIFSIACSWKTKDQEGTEWLPCVAFGKLGEICIQYLRKGSRIYAQGSFKTRSYEKDGKTVYRTEIVLDKMQMLDNKPDAGGARTTATTRPPATQAREQRRPVTEPAGGFVDDDIPFMRRSNKEW